MNTQRTMNTQRGFTLIEFAVVITIIGLLMGGFLLPLTAQIDATKIQSTKKTLNQVKRALTRYAAINNRLPCPASDDASSGKEGIEDLSFCGIEGELPWVLLGVGKNDAWGNPFRYRIDQAYTNDIVVINRKPHPIAETVSKLRVLDKQCLEKYNNEDTCKLARFFNFSSSDKSDVVSVVFSYGKDGVASSEHENATDTYYQGQMIYNDYDDILVFLSKHSLVATGRRLQNTNIATIFPLPDEQVLVCYKMESCLNNGWDDKRRRCLNFAITTCLEKEWKMTWEECKTWINGICI